ncbi:diphthine synthase [Halosimplex aquaticum]|uniref:Diphthine synthase n=1 Tax=Halosimplex aquaticum TaxID=3026162 RepID=A0ABD5XVB7_9EURY|nr:diphthine synthase [Halosimplex aquaticum]
MLTFVGLGLYDERSVTVAGRDAIRSADRVVAEFYTSKLAGATVDDLETYHDTEIEVRDRAGVEQTPDDILDDAVESDVVFLTAGDTMISTTHTDLRLRAHDRGIDTRVVHGTTAQAAASALTGLQNYRFGKATTLPFERSHAGDALPGSVIETIDDNRDRGLHTLVFLDIDAENDDYMRADEAATRLAAAYDDVLAVVVARAGSPDPVVRAGRLSALSEGSFGDPLHLLVIPGDLHLMERDALAELGDAPTESLEELVV